jgi:integral membrane protein (TIGR01906 family)
MNSDQKKPARLILGWAVTLFVPVALILAAVRVVLTPWFLEFEYRTPNFPSDPHGFFLPPDQEPFSREDRLYYANIARLYLLNDEDISFLGDLRFPEGQQTPPLSCQFMDDCTRLFNDRELEHMLDVKVVTQGALRVWYLSLAGLFSLGIWAWFGGWLPDYRRGLRRGGWLTVALLGLVLLFVIAAFGIFFVFFHEVFFDPGTWTFWPSDTLIRLFPERFWRDIFVAVGIIAIGLGVLVARLAPSLKQQNDAS